MVVVETGGGTAGFYRVIHPLLLRKKIKCSLRNFASRWMVYHSYMNLVD